MGESEVYVNQATLGRLFRVCQPLSNRLPCDFTSRGKLEFFCSQILQKCIKVP